MYFIVIVIYFSEKIKNGGCGKEKKRKFNQEKRKYCCRKPDETTVSFRQMH